MNSGLLDDTKSVLKSLIISCPHGMTIERLNRDYREVEGRPIPYSALGYNKLEAFLRSLTDTLVVNGCGLSANVSAVSSQKTAHIDSMVTKQKNSTRRRGRPSNLHFKDNRRSQTPPHRAPLINLIQQPKHQFTFQQPTQNNYHQPTQNNYHQPFRVPQQNYQQNPYNQLQQQALQQQHMARQNLVNNIALQNGGAGLANFMHHPLFNQQPFDNWERFQYSLQTRPQFHAATVAQQRPFNTPPLATRLQNIINQNNQMKLAQQQQQQQQQEQQQQQQQSMNRNEPPETPVKATEEKAADPPKNESRFSNSSQSNTNSSQSERTTVEPTAPKLNSTGVVNGFGSNYRDTFSSSTLTLSSNKSKNSANCDDRRVKLPNDVSFGLMNISDSYLSHLNETFEKLNLNGKNLKDGNRKQDDEKRAEAVPELQQNDIIFQLDYPVDAVKYGEYIPDSELPKDILEANWFGVFITEIHNPFKFWFHVYKENNELDTMMMHIENIYTGLGQSEMRLHKSCFKPGQVCCALFLGMWHRAQILDTPEGNKVKLFFVDYGTVAHIALDEVKFLISEFSSLPCQALRGCLAHIKPLKHRWSREATYAFLDMVSDLLLYAKAVEIDYNEKIVTVILTDTNKNVDFQINEALIRKGHARMAPSEPALTQSADPQATGHRRKHFQELHPTFGMLERGEYPSFSELSILLSKGIDYEELQDQNIIPDLDGGHSIEEITKKLTDTKVTVRTIEDRTDLIESVKRDERNLLLKGFHNHDIANLSTISENSNPFLHSSSSSSAGDENGIEYKSLLGGINSNGENTSSTTYSGDMDLSALESKITINPSNPFFDACQLQQQKELTSAPPFLYPSSVSLPLPQSQPQPQPIYSQSHQQTFYTHIPVQTPLFYPYNGFQQHGLQNGYQQNSYPQNNYQQNNGYPPPQQQQQLLQQQQHLFIPNYNMNQFFNEAMMPAPMPQSALPPPTMTQHLPQPTPTMTQHLPRPPPGFENVTPKVRNLFQ